MSVSNEMVTEPMRYRVFLDNSNLMIEGQRVSAVNKGWARSYRESIERKILDPFWRPSYPGLEGVLLSTVGEIASKGLFGSFGDSVVSERVSTVKTAMERSGWKTYMQTRTSQRREKCVDVDLAVHMTWQAAVMTDRTRTGLVLIAGDRDYVPLVRHLVTNAYHVTVAFWAHAAFDLKRAASAYVDLNEHFSVLSLNGTTPILWAPERSSASDWGRRH